MAVKITEKKAASDNSWTKITKKGHFIRKRDYIPLVALVTNIMSLWDKSHTPPPRADAPVEEIREYARLRYQSKTLFVIKMLLCGLFLPLISIPFIYSNDISGDNEIWARYKMNKGGFDKLSQVSLELRNQETFMKDMIAQDLQATQFLGQDLRESENFNLYLNEHCPEAFQYASNYHVTYLKDKPDFLKRLTNEAQTSILRAWEAMQKAQQETDKRKAAEKDIHDAQLKEQEEDDVKNKRVIPKGTKYYGNR